MDLSFLTVQVLSALRQAAFLFLISSGVGVAAGAAGGAAGFFAGVAFCFPVVSSTDFASLLVETVARPMQVSIKTIAATVVIFDKNDAGPRLPKAVWVAPPPKAPAKSAPFPDCRSTTRTRMTQTITCSVAIA